MKYCSKCGNGNSDESVFCASCGTPLQQAPAAPQPEQPASAPVDPGSYNTSSGAYFTDPSNQSQSNYQAATPVGSVTPVEKNPNTLWLILNIVCTLCCCLPIGVAGIILAAMGTSSYNKGDFEDSKKKAKIAMILFIVGVVGGIITIIVAIATGVLGNLASTYSY